MWFANADLTLCVISKYLMTFNIDASSLCSSDVDEQPIPYEIDDEVAPRKHPGAHNCGWAFTHLEQCKDPEVADQEFLVMPGHGSGRHFLYIEHGYLRSAPGNADHRIAGRESVAVRLHTDTPGGVPVENIQSRSQIENRADLSAANFDVKKIERRIAHSDPLR